MISLGEFKTACPTNKEPEAWIAVLNEILPRYDINTVRRTSMFLCQTGHESNDYRSVYENLNYSAKGLLTTFPKYYNASLAAKHARQPVLIANHVYGGRMGNNTKGDGYFFRGIGIIQLTGRNNHEAFGRSIGMSAEKVRDYLTTKEGMVEAAAWFWKTNGLNVPSDNMDIQRATRIINGGYKGLEDRTARLKRILAYSDTTSPIVSKDTIYKVGDRGEVVKKIQQKLRIAADGVFGPATKKAVRDFQASNGLAADGIVGRDTLKALGL